MPEKISRFAILVRDMRRPRNATSTRGTRPTCPAPRDLKRRSTTNSPSSLAVSGRKDPCYEKHFPPPPEVVQRARCYLARGFCGPTLMSWARPTTTGSTTSWTKSDTGSGSARRCWSGGRVSNRTDSEIIEKLRIVLSRIDCGPQKSPREQYTHWGAAIFCAHTLLVDVRATCPALVREGGSPQECCGQHHKPLSVAVSLHGCGTPRRRAGGTIPEVAELGTEIYLTVQN